MDNVDVKVPNIVKKILQEYENEKLTPIEFNIFKIYNTIQKARSKKHRTDIGDVADVIKQSSSVATELLRVANTAHFKRGHEQILTVEDSLNRVGLDVLFPLIMRYTVAPSNKNTLNIGNFSVDDLWKRNLIDATSAKYICDNILENKIGEQMYVTSLIKNFGIRLLSQYRQKEYEEVIRNTQIGKKSLIDEEKKAFGISHDQLGGLVFREWGFPKKVWYVVASHHRNDFANIKDKELEQRIRTIQFSMRILPEIGFSDAPNLFDAKNFKSILGDYVKKSKFAYHQDILNLLGEIIYDEITPTIKEYEEKHWFLLAG